MIDASLWQSESFAELPFGARLLQVGMINLADDQGRIKAHPSYLRAQIFPYDDIPNAEIQSWLEMIHRHETIILYTVDGKQFAQLTNWWKYQSLQYAQPSQYPRPEGWQDRIRKTFTKGNIVTCNWYTVDGNRVEDTCDMDGNPLPKVVKTPSVPSTPSTNGVSAQHSATVSPVYSPESSPEDTRLTKDKEEITTTLPCARGAEPEEQPNNGGGSGGASLLEPPKLANRQNDPDYAKVCTAIESNGFGFMTPFLAEEVGELLNEYPLQWILDAMRVSVEANKRQMRYVRGILRKWRADGRDPSQSAVSQVQSSSPAQPEVFVMPAAARVLRDRAQSLSLQ